jgi:release factor glutamine methyltransferase
MHAARKPRAWVLAHPEGQLDNAQLVHLAQMLSELERGQPLPYILGAWEFYRLRFAVTSAVLIPRPETELLVETALLWLEQRKRQKTIPLRAIDVGTGSGCIAVSLATHAPQTTWVASDVDPEALKIAWQNASAHGIRGRVTLMQADLLAPFKSQAFDLICANLPYIPSAVLRTLAVYGQEPTLALDGGEDGLAQIRRLLAQSCECLRPGGLLLVEIETSQGATALELAEHYFPDAQIHVRQDYAGHDRLLIIEKL